MIQVFLALAFLAVAILIGRYFERRDLLKALMTHTTITVASGYGCIAPGTYVTMGDAHYRVVSCDRHTITISGV